MSARTITTIQEARRRKPTAARKQGGGVNAESVEGAGRRRERKFSCRESLLTELFSKDEHVRSVRHLAVAAVTMVALDAVFRGNSGISTLAQGFSGAGETALLWTGMFATSLAARGMFAVWRRAPGRSSALWCVPLIIFYALFAWLPAARVARADWSLGICSRIVLLAEQVRLLMKIHSFIRRSVPAALSGEQVGSFGHYVYFLFAPTLLYREQYPKSTKPRRWSRVAACAAEVAAAVFVFAYTVENFLVAGFGRYGNEMDGQGRSHWRSFAGTMLPGAVLLMTGHYLLLHAWLNAWAEALEFGDRHFYSDWWCSGSFPDYYRRWNVVVHDWLRDHLYEEVRALGAARGAAALAVFAVSALVHEYIIGFALQFCYPVLFVQFAGLGAVLAFVRTGSLMPAATGNVLLWLCLTAGTGIQLALYATEFYARVNCPRLHAPLPDLFIPRSWYC